MKEISEIHKELDLIQDVIKRMAANSFEVKKWLIGILTALVVFNHEELLGGNTKLIWGLLLPIVSFWYLDAFFLRTENLYRELYEWVVANRHNTDTRLYDLKTDTRTNANGVTVQINDAVKNEFVFMFWNRTLTPFYLVPFCIVLFLGFFPPPSKPPTPEKPIKIEIYGQDSICKHCSRGQTENHPPAKRLEKQKPDTTH